MIIITDNNNSYHGRNSTVIDVNNRFASFSTTLTIKYHHAITINNNYHEFLLLLYKQVTIKIIYEFRPELVLPMNINDNYDHEFHLLLYKEITIKIIKIWVPPRITSECNNNINKSHKRSQQYYEFRPQLPVNVIHQVLLYKDTIIKIKLLVAPTLNLSHNKKKEKKNIRHKFHFSRSNSIANYVCFRFTECFYWQCTHKI